MAELERDANRFVDPDEAYRVMIEAHRHLSDEESAALNARLVLILANQVGDIGVLRAAVELAGKATPVHLTSGKRNGRA